MLSSQICTRGLDLRLCPFRCARSSSRLDQLVDTQLLVLAFFLASGLAATHFFAGRLRFLDITPRSRWLSGASGVSVAYVFVHILPELAAGQWTLHQATGGAAGFFEHHVYVIALSGMVAFYGLERLAKVSRAAQPADDDGDATTPGVFWLHTTSFAIYNGLIGYLLLHREETGTISLMTFFFAMATHFLVNDYGLRHHHKHRYHAYGRWVLAAAVLIGWAIGAMVELHEAAVAVLFAFLAGGVILNVLKEELPEERKSTFWAFALGAAVYAAVLLMP
jgi:hypothetical protein